MGAVWPPCGHTIGPVHECGVASMWSHHSAGPWVLCGLYVVTPWGRAMGAVWPLCGHTLGHGH
jgi:hypothetical protein